MMSLPAVSRRKFGEIALGASAALLASSNRTEAATQASQRPVYIKDESGISYYDVKTGAGAAPISGDFVIIDYVS